MAYIDVSLNDFETIELIEEVTKRLHRNRKYYLTGKNLKKAIDAMKDLGAALNVLILPVETIDDQAKKEVLIKYWSELTSCQFEEKLSK